MFKIKLMLQRLMSKKGNKGRGKENDKQNKKEKEVLSTFRSRHFKLLYDNFKWRLFVNVTHPTFDFLYSLYS